MNNLKFDYGKKYHYLLKYIIMSIPVLLLVLSFLFPKKEITNNYSVESTTEINYNYQTNDVNNNDDIIINNAYYFDLGYYYSNLDRVSYLEVYVLANFLYLDCSFYIDEIYIVNDIGDIYTTNLLIFDGDYIYFRVYNFANESDCYIYLSVDDIQDISGGVIGFVSDFISNDDDDFYSCVRSLNEDEMSLYVPYNTTTTNTINENSIVLSFDEVRSNNTDYLKPLNDFYKLPFNSWYDNLLSSMNLTIDNDTTYYLYHIPLYIIFVYVFDIILDLFGMFFRLGHKFLNKFGGDY